MLGNGSSDLSRLSFIHSDSYNNISALDPKKLKIFNTVREITGVCVSLCVFLPFVFHCTPSNSFFCPLDRHSEYSVLARRVGRSFCLLKSCNNTRTNTVQVSIQPVLCLLKVVIYLSPYFLTLKCISVNIVLILFLVVCVLFVL